MQYLSPLEIAGEASIGADAEYHKAPERTVYLIVEPKGPVEWHEVDDIIQFRIAPVGAKRIQLKANKGVGLLESLEVFKAEDKLVLLGTLSVNDEELVVNGPTCFVVAKSLPQKSPTSRPYMVHMLTYESFTELTPN